MNRKFQKGATSIYVVMISTLLFTVITVSFIRILTGELARTTSDELAQAAYDSAMAGVEDAKIALKQYSMCKKTGSVLNAAGENKCAQIIEAIEKGFTASDAQPDEMSYGYCDAISVALGRAEEGVEVPIRESESLETKFNQAYTCVIIDKTLGDYRSTLGTNTPMRAVALTTPEPDKVTGIKISWYTQDDGPFALMNYQTSSYFTKNNTTVATPPVIQAHVVQTSIEYTLEQFDDAEGDRTNNMTAILNPVKNGTNIVSAQTLVRSNDHTTTNQAQQITCKEDASTDFACSASLVLPKPRGSGTRRDDTFYLFISLPYEQPTTTFSVQLCTDTDAQPGDCVANGKAAIADFVNGQILIDSTGRANDMYTRIEARVEFNDIYAPLPEHALYSLDPTGSIDKDFYVTRDCWKQKGDWTAEHCVNNGKS